MPDYPYRCEDCDTRWEVSRPFGQSQNPATCPKCSLETTCQDYSAKAVGGFVSTSGNWSGGKAVCQLHPRHPDRMVTSKSQMEKVYRKHGISLDTGHFTSTEAQVAATVPYKQRRSSSKLSNPDQPDTTVVGGVREEK